MVFNGMQTIYGIKLMNRMLIDADYLPSMNTTLNDKFKILMNYKGVEQRYPKINIITIGVNPLVKDESLVKYKLFNSFHNATDAALFNHVPFYLRKVSEIDKHPIPDYLRLRKIEIINDEEYLAAYGMDIVDFVYKNDFVLLEKVTDNYAKILKYEFNDADPLNPKPNLNLDLRYQPANFVSDFVKIYNFWDNKQLGEIKNAMDILGIDNDYKITEIGVCFSKTIKNTITNDNGSFKQQYLEAVETQIAYFIDCVLDLNVEIQDFFIEIGGQQILGNYK